LLVALVAAIAMASIYTLGRAPQRPASVLGDTLSGNAGGGGCGGGTTPPTTSTSTTSTSTTTSTAPLPPPP
jgi:hypothetical protein